MPTGELAFLVWLLQPGRAVDGVRRGAGGPARRSRPGEMRGQVSALFYMVIMLTGLVIGPLAVGCSTTSCSPGSGSTWPAPSCRSVVGIPGSACSATHGGTYQVGRRARMLMARLWLALADRLDRLSSGWTIAATVLLYTVYLTSIMHGESGGTAGRAGLHRRRCRRPPWRRDRWCKCGFRQEASAMASHRLLHAWRASARRSPPGAPGGGSSTSDFRIWGWTSAFALTYAAFLITVQPDRQAVRKAWPRRTRGDSCGSWCRIGDPSHRRGLRCPALPGTARRRDGRRPDLHGHGDRPVLLRRPGVRPRQLAPGPEGRPGPEIHAGPHGQPAGDAFYASFAATTVPLPPSAVLLGTAIAAGLGRQVWRRRSGTP